MPTRSRFAHVNLPTDVLDLIDRIIADARNGRLDGHTDVPIMVQSRDEYVRLAVSILLLATIRNQDGISSLSVIEELVDRLEGRR